MHRLQRRGGKARLRGGGELRDGRHPGRGRGERSRGGDRGLAQLQPQPVSLQQRVAVAEFVGEPLAVFECEPKCERLAKCLSVGNAVRECFAERFTIGDTERQRFTVLERLSLDLAVGIGLALSVDVSIR